MELPPNLINTVAEGRAVLILGAGASLGATNKHGATIPDGKTMAKILAERFLGGQHKTDPLDYVAGLAISETDLFTVQDHIAATLMDFQPTPYHTLVSTFRWRGIATTNYDRIMEEAYDSPSHIQTLVPFLSNEDRVDDKLRVTDALAFLKLHDCVTRTHDVNLPLILSMKDFVRFDKNRNRVYNMLKEWAAEYPFVFVGHRLRDFDLETIMSDLAETIQSRPQWYLVLPGLSEFEQRHWVKRNVTPIVTTFQDFIESLDGSLQKVVRGIPVSDSFNHPISKRLVAPVDTLSDATRQFLLSGCEYVHEGMSIEPLAPVDFYRGFSISWSPIANNLDVKRTLQRRIIAESILLEEHARANPTDAYAILAEAGAGKSVTLRRLAWDSSVTLNRLCLFMQRPIRMDPQILASIARATDERVFLFVDNAAEAPAALLDLIRGLRSVGAKVTIITAERLNEWNTDCANLDKVIHESYVLPYLSSPEIIDLANLLELHKCLYHLEALPQEQRLQELGPKAGRQLLVALHEATFGRDLEDILLDEYEGLSSPEAKRLYLHVCALNRLGIPVRAGLISRVNGIPFSEFKDRLFAPLEHVVYSALDRSIGDMVYSARHPHIAEIVFRRVLEDKNLRFDTYANILANLNVSFSSDRIAFRQMVRGRAIIDLFNDHDDAASLYDIASDASPDDAYVLQQMAIYEMNRPNGSFPRAADLLAQARNLRPSDQSIVHSQAELNRKQADLANTETERWAFRRQASQLARGLRDDPWGGAAAYDTLIKLAIDELREVLRQDPLSEQDLRDAVEAAERELQNGVRKFPAEPIFIARDADLASVLRDGDRALQSLQRSFKANPRSPFIPLRLARMLAERGDVSEAISVLTAANNANPGERRIHFGLGKLLLEDPASDTMLALSHLRKSFAPRDRNFENQFWYAVACFEVGRPEFLVEAREIFSRLRSDAPVSSEIKNGVQWISRDNQGSVREFRGSISRKDVSYALVARDGLGDEIFAHVSENTNLWETLSERQRVRFSLGYALRGPVVVDMHRE